MSQATHSPPLAYIRYRTLLGRECVEGPFKRAWRLNQRTEVLLGHVRVQPDTVEVFEKGGDGWQR